MHLADVGNALLSAMRKDSSSSRNLTPMCRAEIFPLILASQLALLAYAASPNELRSGLEGLPSSSRPELIWFQQRLPRDPSLHDGCSQWYLLRMVAPSGEPTLYLVFRGTHTVSDMMQDIKFGADSRTKIHSGFLACVKEDKTLQEQINKHVRGSADLCIVGHSLGGALALVVHGAGMIPRAHTGRRTVVSIGSPAVFHRDALLPPQCADGRIRLVSIVQDGDVVPRLLGSPLPMTRKVFEVMGSVGVGTMLARGLGGVVGGALLKQGLGGGGGGSASVASKVLQWSARHAAGSGLGSAAASKASSKAGSVFESVTGIRSVPPRNGEGGGLVDQTLGTLEDYRHPDSLEVVLLSGGKAMHVPASERPKVMHMHEVFRPDLMGRWLSCHMQANRESRISSLEPHDFPHMCHTPFPRRIGLSPAVLLPLHKKTNLIFEISF